MTENDKIAHERERGLYDIFDEHGVYIGISCRIWRSIPLFYYEIAQKGKIHIEGEVLYSRHEAEAAAFNKAYEVVDYEKLK